MAKADPQIKIIIDDIDATAAKVVTALTLEVTAEVQEATPVDTGWARANWVPKIGEPETMPRPRIVDNVAGRMAEQQAAVAGVVTGYNSIKKGQVSIANNVPYIKDLNEGSSKKAPAAFVQQAISRAVAKVVGKFK